MAVNQIRGNDRIQRKSTTLDRLTTVPAFYVRVLSLNNITLSGVQVIDGITPNDGNLIAVFGQTTVTETGIYVYNSGGAWVRSHLAEVGYDMSGHIIQVIEGTTRATTQWSITNAQGAGIVGTDNLLQLQISGTGAIDAQNGLQMNGGLVELGGPLTRHTNIYPGSGSYNLDINCDTNIESSVGNRIDSNYYGGHSGIRIRNSAGSKAFEFLDNANPLDLFIRMGQDEFRMSNTPSGAVADAVVDVAYVHSVIQGRYNTARVFADSNLTLSGTQTVDGIALADGDTCYAGSQTTVSEDGLYIVRAGAWERQFGWEVGDGVAGITITILEGTNYGDTKWLVTNNTGSDVIGTDDIVVSELTGAGNITAGAGLVWTSGNTLDVVAADLSILVNADDLQVNIGNTNGDSLEVSASGLELRATIDGNRTFSQPLTIGAYTLPNTDGGAGESLVTDGSGVITWTDATVKINEVEADVYTLAGAASGETVTLTQLGTHATVKVVRVKVFYEGQMLLEGAGNDYTYNALTGVISFIGVTHAADTVQVAYSTQDA